MRDLQKQASNGFRYTGTVRGSYTYIKGPCRLDNLPRREFQSAVTELYSVMAEAGTTKPRHELDDDACCVRCGFDAAEWSHLERLKPERDREPEPECRSLK